ncbi:hypothetical protein RF11_11164 [Thelohanellus kitauei]|uniref:Apple domain-containing protein n=1 Tax=Thelohanellus kitauei TaxID=669202 RepID=A0A0C2N594_THEKT|nr:hypothetical protein RF11_11164 [Thelohanellus kitauei]
MNGIISANSSVLPYIPTSTLSISLWVWFDKYDVDITIFKCHNLKTGDAVILSYISPQIIWIIHFNRTDHKFTTTAHLDIQEIDAKRWIHITVTYNSIFGLANIFKNGRLLQASYVDGEKLSPDMWMNGEYHLWVSSETEARGKLDELYIIDSAIGNTEIHDLMGLCNIAIDFGIPLVLQEDPSTKQSINQLPSLLENQDISCKNKNITEYSDMEMESQMFTIQHRVIRQKDCQDQCCKNHQCIAYNYKNELCTLYLEEKDMSKFKACLEDFKYTDSIRGRLEGQLSQIFISAARDLESCVKLVCKEKQYDSVLFDTESFNCFGIYCTNYTTCKILVNDEYATQLVPTRSNHIYSMRH